MGARRVRLPRVPSPNPAGGFHETVRCCIRAVFPGSPHLRLRGDGADETVGAVGVSSVLPPFGLQRAKSRNVKTSHDPPRGSSPDRRLKIFMGRVGSGQAVFEIHARVGSVRSESGRVKRFAYLTGRVGVSPTTPSNQPGLLG